MQRENETPHTCLADLRGRGHMDSWCNHGCRKRRSNRMLIEDRVVRDAGQRSEERGLVRGSQTQALVSFYLQSRWWWIRWIPADQLWSQSAPSTWLWRRPIRLQAICHWKGNEHRRSFRTAQPNNDSVRWRSQCIRWASWLRELRPNIKKLYFIPGIGGWAKGRFWRRLNRRWTLRTPWQPDGLF